MKATKMCVSAVAMTLMVFSVLSVSVIAGQNGEQKDKPDVMGFALNQNIAFGEVVDGVSGIYTTGELFDLGPFVNETTGKDLMAYGEPVDAVANWSDDLVLHQFKAGSKIRTEVILWDLVHSAAVYTIRAHFAIQEIDPVSKAVVRDVWDGTVAEGLWADGLTDAYSAEVNQLGMLLYGYNWDTRALNCHAGMYRLTFTVDAALPDNVPFPNTEAQDLTITGVDDVSTEFTDVFSSSASTWIEMTLLPSGGR
ncbi:MAG TPA: hypothetical protein VMW71_06335 [Thermoplasmata archaeon]|nr:hypothetical protein [Thermoplasmata archaeon]